MQRPSDSIDAWLREIAPTLPGAPAGDRAEFVVTRHIARPEADIHLGSFRWPDASLEACVKTFTKGDDRRLTALFERSDHLRDALDDTGFRYPRILATNRALATIVMSIVPGTSLEERIARSLWRGEAAFEECRGLLERTAVAIARMHEVPIPDEAPMARPCSNKDYVRRLAGTALRNEFVLDCLRGSDADPERVLEALPPAFWTRHEHRMLHGDFQAKNVLVGDDGGIALIDIDYGVGHPLRDIAQFLVQLERMSRRWRLPRFRARIRRYGEVFLDHYARQGFGHVLEDLPFFRLWATAFSLAAEGHRSWPARYLIKRHIRA